MGLFSSSDQQDFSQTWTLLVNLILIRNIVNRTPPDVFGNVRIRINNMVYNHRW